MPLLDHLVVLLPHASLASPPPWLSSAFKILPGGRHADKSTENTLILLPDGTYIELIAFVPSVPRPPTHPWSPLGDGHIIDLAFSLPATGPSTPEHLFAPIRERVNTPTSPFTYPAPRAGGRTKPDGTVIEWATSFPEPGSPGTVPFWCLDRTPRELRVPYQAPGNADHPSRARGVAALDITVPSQEVLDVYARIQGVDGRRGEDGATVWDLDVPGEQGQKVELRVRVAENAGAERIKLTVLTEKGTEAKTIGGEVAEGVKIWIDLKPLA